MNQSELILRYGCNPHQAPARVYMERGVLPVRVVNGSPGYINLLDALNAWQLVRELAQVLGMPAAASFKHVSPAGAAIGLPMSEPVRKACFVEDMELSPLAVAYARARGADRMSSYGDWVALSAPMDVSTARLLKRETSDGVIAPGFEPQVLDILKSKKGGKYTVLEINPDYVPPSIERREVFGVVFEQKHNDTVPGFGCLEKTVTEKRDMPDSARRDLIVAQISLKYTQSNSICFAHDGQLVGVGAGQQSRVHCTRLAASKADRWFLRQHPAVLGLKFRDDIKRADMNNAIDQYLEEFLTPAEEREWKKYFEHPPQRISAVQKRDWLDTVTGVSMASDAYFPFRDSIDRASRSGVSWIVQPGGALRDDVVIDACNEYGMVMAFSGLRLFHH